MPESTRTEVQSNFNIGRLFEAGLSISSRWKELLDITNLLIGKEIDSELLSKLQSLQVKFHEDSKSENFKLRVQAVKKLILLDAINPKRNSDRYDPYGIQSILDECIQFKEIDTPRFQLCFDVASLYSHLSKKVPHIHDEYLEAFVDDVFDLIVESIDDIEFISDLIQELTNRYEPHKSNRRASRKIRDAYDIDDIHVLGKSITIEDIRSLFSNSKGLGSMINNTNVLLGTFLDYYNDLISTENEEDPAYLYNSSKTKAVIDRKITEFKCQMEVFREWINLCMNKLNKSTRKSYIFLSSTLSNLKELKNSIHSRIEDSSSSANIDSLIILIEARLETMEYSREKSDIEQ